MVKWNQMTKEGRIGVFCQRFALMAMVACSLHMLRESFFFERSVTFSEGMETCFERLRRSYVSVLSGQDWPEISFFQDTESCFSELVFYTESHFSPSLVKSLAPINALVKDIHWFHKDLQRLDGKSGLHGEFAQLEDARREIIDRMESERRSRGRFLGISRNVLGAALGTGMIFFLLGLFSRRKRGAKIVVREAVPSAIPAGPFPEPEGSQRQKQQQEEKEGKYPGLEKVSPMEVLAIVLDSLADKILLQGIRVEPHIGENSRIYAKEEFFREGLEILLGDVVRAFGDSEGCLRISEERRGERTVLLVESFTEQNLGGKKIFDLIEKAGGRSGSPAGGQFRMSFSRASDAEYQKKKGKNRLIKGKKRDVLRQLSELRE